ncbi:MAG: LPS export ABC transporter permease LptF [Gammaproteobacteria bacterium]|nr:LPS export ABC transporter permease LptF [Gammaproteobacteria bacterium]
MFKRHLSIIDRYIAKELLLTWLAVVLVLMLILISSTLARLLGKAAEGAMPSDAVWPLLFISSIRYFISMGSLGLYLGVLLCFSRLYKDNEMAVLGACGIGLGRLYRSMMLVVIPVSLVMLIMALYVRPWALNQTQVIKAEVESRSELSGLVAGRFNQSQDGTAIMFLEKQSDDGQTMQNVFLHQAEKVSTHIETAALARQYTDDQGRNFILFERGQHYEGQPGQSDFMITQYEKHGVYLAGDDVVKKVEKMDALATSAIWNSDNLQHQAELQWRLSVPLSTFLLAILALPLSYTTPRKGRYSKLALAILIYLLYSNLLGVGQSWIETQKMPAGLGLWWVHGSFVVFILLVLNHRSGGFKQLMRNYRLSTAR